MSQFACYPAYKDSGVEWLGKIPEHWPVFSLKRTVDGCVNGLWGAEPDEENDITVIRVADFDRRISRVSIDKLTLRSITLNERVSRLLKLGDLLIEKSGGGEKTLVGCVVLFEHDIEAVTSNFVARMRPLQDFDSSFLCYAFHTLYEGKVNYPSIKQTTGIQNLDSEAYLQERFCFPPPEEQIKISRFLDHETTKIDSLIKTQQRLIELLKEKRQAVISHAVTKGLDPNAPMKDSGVEWLGEIPAHWRLKPLKSICRFSGGGTPAKNVLEYWNGDIPWASPKDMKVFWLGETIDHITEKAILESSTNLVPPGALLIVVRSGILQRTIPVAINTVPVSLNQDMKALRFSDLKTAEFFAFVVKGLESSLLLAWRKEGATVESIEHEYLANTIVPVPPESELTEIVKTLTELESRFEGLTAEALESISLLQERRSALISAAVTGKIDVRDWQPPLRLKICITKTPWRSHDTRT